jgi:hypothetical protein
MAKAIHEKAIEYGARSHGKTVSSAIQVTKENET